jgi:GNAT superfamily N-acetyltransferase
MTEHEQRPPGSQTDPPQTDRGWQRRLYSPSDREGVFQLRATVYGESFTEDDWVWKFETSPLGAARIYLAESNGVIVGLRIFNFREAKVLDEVWPSIVTVDGMVHPDFQRRGIWSALMREGLDELRAEGIHLALSFPGIHRHTYAGFLKLGWSDTGSVPLLVKPLRPGALLSRFVRGELAQGWSDRAFRFLAGTDRQRGMPGDRGLSIERIESFDERFDGLWEQVSGQSRFSLVRDKKYLNYRYRDRPGDKYSQFAAYRGEDLKGYIVVRRSLEMFGLPIGLIMDMGASEGGDAARSLVDAAVDFLDAEGVAAIGCLIGRHSRYHAALRRAGFLPVPKRFNSRDYHPVVDADPAKLSKGVMGDGRNWHFTYGDFDVG